MQGKLKRARSDEKQREIEAELAMPPFPDAVGYLWTAYWRIRSRRGGNGWGANPIEWGDIADFVRLSGMHLVPWEVAIIEALDDAWLASHRDGQADGGATSRSG